MPKFSIFQKQFFIRILLFAVLFIIVSGITGAWVVSTRLLYGFNFYLYGNLGKMVLISIVVLGLLLRDLFKDLEKLPKVTTNIVYIALSFILIPAFFFFGNNLLHYKSFSSNIQLSLVTHLVLVAIPSLLLLGIFGISFLTAFVKRFRKEILACICISIGFDIAIFQVWKLWPFFSGGVLITVKFLLSLTFSNVTYFPPFTLSVNNFMVAILQACSGLDSLFMFSALYALIGLTDYRKLNMIKFFSIFPIAALGMYIVNIFRVYILIVIGAVISPEFALNLFHTYAGMILFLVYFGFFWKIVYKRILKNKYVK